MSAIWVDREERAFSNFLADHIAEAGDGGSYKATTFAAAATHIAPYLERGPAKTGQMCKNKYGAMRAAWKVVCAIKKVSGWTWNDTTRASINQDTSSSWDDYVAQHPAAKPYQNRGWPHASSFEIILPTPVSGSNVFIPTATPTPAPTSSQQAHENGDQEDSEVPTPSASQEDGADESDDSSDAQTVVVGPKHRRSAAASPPVSKRNKTTPAASAISGLSSSMDNFANAIVTAITAPPPSASPESIRLSAAIQTAIALESSWLSTDELRNLVNLFCKKQAHADTYMAMEKSEDVRRAWVGQRLNIL